MHMRHIHIEYKLRNCILKCIRMFEVLEASK